MKTIDQALAGLPADSAAAAKAYIESGVKPGGFLYAVFSNQLVESVLRADDANRAALTQWVTFVSNHAPWSCWGSPQRVEDWISTHGS